MSPSRSTAPAPIVGTVEAGCSYVVGEEGPETLRPRASGTIIPNDAQPAAPARAGRPGIVMRNVFKISGSGDPEAVTQCVAAVLDKKYHETVGGRYADYGLDTA